MQSSMRTSSWETSTHRYASANFGSIHQANGKQTKHKALLLSICDEVYATNYTRVDDVQSDESNILQNQWTVEIQLLKTQSITIHIHRLCGKVLSIPGLIKQLYLRTETKAQLPLMSMETKSWTSIFPCLSDSLDTLVIFWLIYHIWRCMIEYWG